MNTVSSIGALVSTNVDGAQTAVAVVDAFANVSDIDLAALARADAVAMAKALEKAEGKAAEHGKAWGQRRLILQKLRNVEAASLDKADKAAIGWDKLDGKSPAKRRLSKWMADLRFVCENWDELEPAQRGDLVAGNRSFLTVADAIRTAQRKAKAETSETSETTETATATATPMSLAQMAEAFALAYIEASESEKASASAAIEMLIDAINADGGLVTVEAPEQVTVAA